MSAAERHLRGRARRIAVVGAGWAGCAAAAELAQAGHQVTLLEASRTVGGRARVVDAGGRLLDNGQHILLGAYSETLRLMRAVGIDASQALLRLPLQMRYPRGSGGMEFAAWKLPAPLHLAAATLGATGLERADKLALARFSTTARWMGWQLNVDCSVAELLERYDQTERLIRLMWRPLCIAALNTPPERASARIFLNVLRDSMGARRAASDMLLPRLDLSALFPRKAADLVERRGGSVQIGAAVQKIFAAGDGWNLEWESGAVQDADAVILAVQAAQAARLLREAPEAAALAAFAYEPITTCYLQYGASLRLEQPFFALVDDPAAGRWGQFVFDRGQLDPAQPGLLAVVISASSQATGLPADDLVAAVGRQLAEAFRQDELAHPAWSKVISEKRATFSCAPGIQRPDNATSMPGLYLAGDYTAGDYPATLEAAVRSGVRAARLAMH